MKRAGFRGLAWILPVFILAGVTPWAMSSRVRHVEVKGDQIVVVRTALGVATLLQVPDQPNSVVVGNQGAFKIEYLDQAVTVKPLRSGAKSNLYIYTDWGRFNVQLVTGQEGNADYVVYLAQGSNRSRESKDESPKARAPGVAWRKYARKGKGNGLSWEVTRLGQIQEQGLQDGILLVEFELSSKNNLTVDPAWFWLTQGGRVRPIQSLVLSSRDVRPGAVLSGLIQIRKTDVEGSAPLRLELRREGEKTSSIAIAGDRL